MHPKYLDIVSLEFKNIIVVRQIIKTFIAYQYQPIVWFFILDSLNTADICWNCIQVSLLKQEYVNVVG